MIFNIVCSVLQIPDPFGPVYHQQLSYQVLGHILNTLGPVNFS